MPDVPAHVRERAVALVAIERVRQRRVIDRRGIRREAAGPPRHVPAQVQGDVVAHVQIEVAVAFEIEERGPRTDDLRPA